MAHKTSRGKEFLMITRDHRVYLINVNLYKTHVNKFDLSVKQSVHLSLEKIQCNGLILCVLRDIRNMFVVWNPYLCKRRWIKWPSGRFEEDQIAFGYDNSSCGIFGVSLKGDYYSYARDQESHGFLWCFDFKRERFGPRLPLPVDPSIVHGVSLSTVREEQLGLLVNRSDTYKMEVLVTNKIEPDAVFWTNFLKVDMNSVGKYIGSGSFYIVEEENMVVVFGGRKRMFRTCIVGDNEAEVGSRRTFFANRSASQLSD
ncbi:hypothetical protein HID58_014263 [Brassica napus]|uniref:F-box associated beta-propeller type 1 domain-containing protein n=1 Tax=Brassica napus TaxID=3708 RepID=A0ABQ8DJA3_BRANA|nr:hypothetical protein HID58_014263 [Brassica napus]